MSTKFFLSFLKAPGMVGSVLPSSSYLANALCRHTRGARHIIELGAGTGAITKHLRHTFPNVPMVIVERDKEQAKALELRFGRCKVVAQCLHEQPELLSDLPADTVIVSSLPFISLPSEVASRTIAMLCQFLAENSRRRLVQYTYGPRQPFTLLDTRLSWQRHQLVLRNLPPAWVWTLSLTVPVEI